MTPTHHLFIELIRLSLGVQDSLSHTPDENEWARLYALSRMHSIEGICFVGVQQLCDKRTKYYGGMSRAQYVKWLGVVTSIQTSNETINGQCVQLQDLLKQNGFASIILKGQSLTPYYTACNPKFTNLRHAGDIDAWLWPINEDGSLKNIPLEERRRQILAFARSYNPGEVCYHHVDAKIFNDTEVELHFIPSWFTSPVHNRRWVKWQEGQFCPQHEGSVNVASTQFNLVYNLLHIYRHLFQEGIGLRQLLDYYFVLRAATDQDRAQALNVLKSFKLGRFLSGIMYIMRTVFLLEDEYLLCEPDNQEGEFILSEILQAGNFGKFDRRIKSYNHDSKWKRFVHRTARSTHFLTHYPSEVLLLPFWKLWHQAWMKTL